MDEQCYGCLYYGGVITPATTTRELSDRTVPVCDECAKWYDSFAAETTGGANAND